ncbi:hypothetical protein CRENPOLYSF2_1020015 [Crenothrix polyspora]|uniref:Uncharacterized protein n=1 Tax=Crenothrix polyspora TaxID=360316 RepID=A0A1R4GYP1_9GAMM|nr:hypothetical protein CRENPOLYSF2_1020015 [Crenothrix polyspora]
MSTQQQTKSLNPKTTAQKKPPLVSLRAVFMNQVSSIH